jgi:hypothetical protein
MSPALPRERSIDSRCGRGNGGMIDSKRFHRNKAH